MNHSDVRPEWSHATTERSYLFPAIIILLVLAGGAYAAYAYTRPTVQYAISSDTFSRLNRAGKDLALRLNAEPCNRDVAAELANALSNGSEYAATISFVTYTEKKCGDNEYLWSPLVDAQMGSSDFTGAEATLGRALELHPNSTQAYYERGKARSSLRNYQDAYEDFRKAIYIYSDPSSIAYNVFDGMARAAVKLGRPCEAVSVMQDYAAFDNLQRRTPAILGLMRDWQAQGKCADPFGSGKARIKYTRNGNVIILPVQINNVTANMIIDTGASRTTLTKSFAARAGIVADKNENHTVSTANGETMMMGGRAKRIALGSASSGNVPVFIHTGGKNAFGPDVDGLLGISFLGNFKFTVNNGVLELTPLS